MPAVVKLTDIIEAMDLPEEWEAFIDPTTGEIVVVGEDDRPFLDSEEDVEPVEMPDWQEEPIVRIRAVLDSGRAVRLPGAFEIHEWELMRRFAASIEDSDERAEILAAIRGSGAFRRFKMTVARLDLRDSWFRYRDEAVREKAREWLSDVGIPYVE